MSNVFQIKGVVCPTCKAHNSVFLGKPRPEGKKTTVPAMCDKCFKGFEIETHAEGDGVRWNIKGESK